MTQHFGYCRGCGKMILWTTTKAGKPMPCDPEIIRFKPMSRFGENMGPEKFMTPEGNVYRGVRDPAGDKLGYISHFATCPNAGDFRRRK